MKMSNCNSIMNSEFEKLNDLERRINHQIEVDDDTEDVMSHDELRRIQLQDNINNMYYAQSENQSPNQDAHKRDRKIIKSKDSVYWNIASNMNSENGSVQQMEVLNRRFVPRLNIDKIHN